MLDDMPAIAAASELIDRVWSAPGLMPPNLTRAIQQAGGYVAGAFADGEMVGASVAFRGVGFEGGHEVPTLHSHVTGVLTPGIGIGTALKRHQRAWGGARGIVAVTWTMDPLVARNAWFNITRLGVQIPEYSTDHYGEMSDGLNQGDRTDRLKVWWPTGSLLDETTDCREADDETGLKWLLRRSSDGRPISLGAVPRPSARTTGVQLAVQLPHDIEALRRTDMATALQWRIAVRESLAPAIAAGYRVCRFDREATYYLRWAGPVL